MLTAQDLYGLAVIDAIIAEPRGGAHRQPEAAIDAVGAAVAAALAELAALEGETLRRQRREKFLAMGPGGK